MAHRSPPTRMRTPCEQRMLSRRELLRLALAAGSSAVLLPACASAPAQAPATAPAPKPAAPAAAPTAARQLTAVRISAFNPPSLGSFLPPIIKQFEFDKANGLDLEFVYKPSDTYNIDFAAGQDLVGGSSAIISEARRVSQGVPVRYLFNVFTFYGAIVTGKPEIKTLKDVEGKTIAADTVTTAWAMMRFFMLKAGVDLSKVQVQNQGTAGMVALLQADRVDAVAAPEPTVSVILNQGQGRFRAIGVFNADVWRRLAGDEPVANLGLAAHTKWLEANKEAVPRLYATYAAAVTWAREHPAEAGQIIGTATKLNPKALEEAITAGRMGFQVEPASKLKRSIEAVLDAAVETQQLSSKPKVDDLIYAGL